MYESCFENAVKWLLGCVKDGLEMYKSTIHPTSLEIGSPDVVSYNRDMAFAD